MLQWRERLNRRFWPFPIPSTHTDNWIMWPLCFIHSWLCMSSTQLLFSISKQDRVNNRTRHWKQCNPIRQPQTSPLISIFLTALMISSLSLLSQSQEGPITYKSLRGDGLSAFCLVGVILCVRNTVVGVRKKWKPVLEAVVGLGRGGIEYIRIWKIIGTNMGSKWICCIYWV